MIDEALARISEIERRLGLPKQFYLKLEHEDDWSFVIKLNALFEAACTHLLTVRLQSPELEESFAHLDFGNPKFGKVVLLRKLGCLSQPESKFLQLILELRNKLAHSISYVSFTFSEHLQALDKNQSKSFAVAVRAEASETIYWNCRDEPREKFILMHPKPSIWLTGADVLLSMHDSLMRLHEQRTEHGQDN